MFYLKYSNSFMKYGSEFQLFHKITYVCILERAIQFNCYAPSRKKKEQKHAGFIFPLSSARLRSLGIYYDRISIIQSVYICIHNNETSNSGSEIENI